MSKMTMPAVDVVRFQESDVIASSIIFSLIGEIILKSSMVYCRHHLRSERC